MLNNFTDITILSKYSLIYGFSIHLANTKHALLATLSIAIFYVLEAILKIHTEAVKPEKKTIKAKRR